MKTIAVASGKGGAGKTSVAAALSAAFGLRGISADCDVDAANGAIALGARIVSSEDYWAGDGYAINASACLSCGACALACRFNAIERLSAAYAIDEALCERCGACMDVCPSGALFAENKRGGALFVSTTRWESTLVHAELVPGEDTSGKLVRSVRQRAEAEAAAADSAIEAIIVDAPPGIGCPVIASLSGADLAAGRLVKPFVFTMQIDFGYYVVSPEKTANLPKVRWFREWLLEEAGASTREVAAA